jgi:hypothetical protein
VTAPTTYATLVSAIPDWMQRPADAEITAIAPDCITLLESRLNFGFGEPGETLYSPPLRIEDMMTRATASLTGEYVAVPDDFLEMRGPMKVNDNPEVRIDYITPDQFAATAPNQSAGAPRVFTIAGAEFRFGPVPSSGTAELWYYAKIPALTASNTTNWLLTKAPNVYLFGCLVEAYHYIKQEQDALRFHGMLSGAVRALQAQDRRRKYGSAPLVMRTGVQTP